jgi:hypothetical protein
MAPRMNTKKSIVITLHAQNTRTILSSIVDTIKGHEWSFNEHKTIQLDIE